MSEYLAPTEELFLELCRGRHEVPLAKDGALFPYKVEDIEAVSSLEEMASKHIAYLISKKGKKIRKVNIFVTGFTPALIAGMNACRNMGLAVKLWHFNFKTGQYFPQEVR